jgi:hypothetical protein
MGFFKDTKAAALAREASKAIEDGEPIFTPRLNFPQTMHGMTGAITDWSMMVAEVEAAGWRLEHWSVAMDTKGRPEAYPVFRRSM